MSRLRVGTRGSDLALIQTRWVCGQLRAQHTDLEIEEVILSTHGDRHPHQPVMDEDWPMGGFVGSIERALLDGRIDFAVHSYKDLPTVETAGLAIAAVPAREAAHDVLLTAEPVALDELPAGMRIGTSSPRRIAQLARLAAIEAVPIRGNVPTRIARLGRDLDGVVLAAAGLRRLSIDHPHRHDLPIEHFVPAAGQGALAVQVRAADDDVRATIAPIDHYETRLAVTAERALLATLGGGCAAPAGASARIRDSRIELRGQLFENGREANEIAIGDEPLALAQQFAELLKKRTSE